MTTIALILSVTLAFGLVAHFVRLPPLVGFLVAGFALNTLSTTPPAALEVMAEVGVTLLLFTIGLKFDLRTLVRGEMWGSAALHLLLSSLVGAGFVGLIATIFGVTSSGDWGTFALVGFALSFSSTVLCVKVLETRSDEGSLYGQTAIGILVMQDVAAVVFMAFTKGHPPSPWALLLVLVVPLSWVCRLILDRLGRGELVVLFGVVLALVPGWYAFEIAGLKGDLGALVMGLLLSLHPRSTDLARTLFGIKELLLVGFFVSIGFHGLPTVVDLGVAALLIIVQLPIQAALYLLLMRHFGLRNATATKATLVLSNFSEFGIIVAAVGASAELLDERWLVIMAVTVAASMIVSTLVNRRGAAIIDRVAGALPVRAPEAIKAYDRPIDVGDAEAIVLGMGRIGRAAYDRLTEQGKRVLGIEHDEHSAAELVEQGYRVVQEDATDAEFWERVRTTGSVGTVLLAMPEHGSNEYAVKRLRDVGFTGVTAAVVRYADEAQHLTELGVDAVFNLYSGAGYELADQALRRT